MQKTGTASRHSQKRWFNALRITSKERSTVAQVLTAPLPKVRSIVLVLYAAAFVTLWQQKKRNGGDVMGVDNASLPGGKFYARTDAITCLRLNVGRASRPTKFWWFVQKRIKRQGSRSTTVFQPGVCWIFAYCARTQNSIFTTCQRNCRPHI